VIDRRFRADDGQLSVAYERVKIVWFGVCGCLVERFRRLGCSVLWITWGVVCKTVGF
jgi:hypothetical protein